MKILGKFEEQKNKFLKYFIQNLKIFFQIIINKIVLK